MTLLTLVTLFTAVSHTYHIPKGLMSSVCWVESGHKISAVNRNDGGEDSIGACQLHYSTAKWLGFKGSREELYLPKNNVKYAAKYLQYQLKRYDGSIPDAIAAYNAGRAVRLRTGAYLNMGYVLKVFKAWSERR